MSTDICWAGIHCKLRKLGMLILSVVTQLCGQYRHREEAAGE